MRKIMRTYAKSPSKLVIVTIKVMDGVNDIVLNNNAVDP